MKKIKLLVLENVDRLESEMSQYINTFDESKYDIDIFTDLVHAEFSEIKKRVVVADEICLQSLFVNREQLSNTLKLLDVCAETRRYG